MPKCNLYKIFIKYIPVLVKLCIGILPIIYLYGFILFIKYLPKSSIFNKQDNNIDAIVVLTGGSARIPEGLRMLQNNQARLLFISGLFTELSIRTYKNILSKFKKINYNNIHYDTVAKTTIENAEQTKIWINKNGVKSIYLVTSYYHIPRAIYLMKKYIPKLKILPYPVFPINFESGGIYNFRIFSLIFFEYNKYVLSNIFIWAISIFE